MNKKTVVVVYLLIRILVYAFFGYLYGMVASLFFSMVSMFMIDSFGDIFAVTENLTLYVVIFSILSVVVSFVWLLLLFLYHKFLLRQKQELNKKRVVCFGVLFGLIILPVYTFLSSLAFHFNNKGINLHGLVIDMLVMFFGVVLVCIGICIIDALTYYFVWKKCFR
ncbi:MAG: hypothetical protein HQM16_09475 [Deltaproteobacteria bacterium]|nr:hypothetical protein [Deltaproteobacteria bacterium]